MYKVYVDKPLMLTLYRDRKWLIYNRFLCAKKLEETVSDYSHTCQIYGRESCDMCNIVKKVILELRSNPVPMI